MESRLSRWRPWTIVFGLAVAYIATARLGLALGLPPDHKVTAIWPPSGIAFAAVLIFGLRVWPGIWLGAFLANLWDAFDPDRTGALGTHVLCAAAIAVGSTLQGLAGAGLVRRFVGTGYPLDRPRDVFRFAAVAPAMCLIASTIGVATLCASGVVPWGAFGAKWWTWWLGDTVGVLVLAPALLAHARPRPTGSRIGREPVLFFALLAGACVLVFGFWLDAVLPRSPRTYLLLPFLVVAAVRFGTRGASAALLVVAGLGAWGTFNNHGPFDRVDETESLLLLDFFLAVVVVMSLALCAVLKEGEDVEAALRASEAQFRHLAEAVPQIVWATAPDGAIVYLNHQWTDYTGLTGVSRDDLARVIHPDDLPHLIGASAGARRAGAVFQNEFRMRPARGGAYRWFLARSVAVVGPDGAPAGRIGTSTDVDELKQAQAELVRQRADLQLILDTVPALIFHKDRDHRLVRVNNELVRLVGLPREALEGHTDAEIGSPHADRYRRDDEEIMTTGREMRGLIEPLYTLAGSRWLQTSKLPYRDSAGRITGVIGFSVDVTEQKLAEDEVRRLNAELEQRVADRAAVAEARTAELQCAVEALREQKQLLQSVLDSLGEAVLVVDKAGQFLMQNRAFRQLHPEPTEHLTHVERARANGVYLPDGGAPCPPDRLPIVRAVRGESCDNVELVIVDDAHPGGVPISVTGRPILGPNGVEGGVIAIRNVAEVRAAAAALRESEERYALAVRGSQDGIWDWDLRTGTVYFSPRWKSMLGYAEHEIPNLFSEWERLVHPAELPGARAAVGAYLDGTAPGFGLELRMLHKDGAYRWIYTRGVAQYGPDGSPYRMGGSHTDVTARRASEAALRESEKRFRAIFDQTFQFIGLMAADGTLLEANRTALTAAGLAEAEVLGKPFWETPWWAHDPVQQARLRDAVARANRGETVRFVATHRASNGEVLWVDFSLKPFHDADGAVALLIPEGRDITAIKRSADTLEATEALLRQFIKHAPAAIAMLDTEMRYVQTSDRWLTDYHLTGQDVIGRTHYEVFPDVPVRWKEIHQRVLAGAVEACAEDPFPRADGRTEWLQWEARPWRKVGGEIGGLVFYTQVITDRIRAAEALRDSEERYRLLIEGVADYAIYMLDAGGRVASWNPGAERIKGYTAEEIIGCHLSTFYPPEDVAAGRVEWALAAAADGHFEDEGWRVRKGGSRFWAGVVIRAVRDVTGRLRGYAKITRDLTNRRSVELALRESEERFRSAFDFAPIGVALVSPDGHWLKVNQSVCALVGYSEPELLAIDFQTITHPDDLGTDLALVEGVLSGTRATYQMEKRYFHKAGHVVHALLAVSLVRDPRGHPLYFISQIQDITERKQAEGRLLASVREKEVMLKEIHHRVKNNLQIISTLLDLQADGVTDPAALVAFRESRGRVRSMALIHERLYRSENLASVEFGTYVRNLAEDLFRAYRADDEAIRLSVSVSVPPVPLDIAIPCGLLVNELVSNCLKYAFAGRESGMIDVSLETTGTGTNVLTVADDGVGLPPGLDFRHTSSFGLQLANTLVEQLGGDIALESSGGARFTVRFPSRG